MCLVVNFYSSNRMKYLYIFIFTGNSKWKHETVNPKPISEPYARCAANFNINALTKSASGTAKERCNRKWLSPECKTANSYGYKVRT